MVQWSSLDYKILTTLTNVKLSWTCYWVYSRMTTLSSLKSSSQHSSPLIWESTFTLVENLINTYILILWEYWTSTCLYYDYIVYIMSIKSTVQPWFGSLFVLSSVYKYNCHINGIKSYRIEILTLCTLSFSLAYLMCIFI